VEELQAALRAGWRQAVPPGGLGRELSK